MSILIALAIGCLFVLALNWILSIVDEWRMRRRIKRRVAAIRAWNDAVKAREKGEQAPGWKMYGGYTDKDHDAPT